MSAPPAESLDEAQFSNDPPQTTIEVVQTLLQTAERNIVEQFENVATPRPQLARALRENNRAAARLLANAFQQRPAQDILEDAVRREALLLQEWNLTRFGTGEWDTVEGTYDVYYRRESFPLRRAAADADHPVARREMLQYSWFGLPPQEFENVRNLYQQGQLDNIGSQRLGTHLREALRAMGLTLPALASTPAAAPAPTTAVAPTPGPTEGTNEGNSHEKAYEQAHDPPDAPTPVLQGRKTGHRHSGIRGGPSPNLPMPEEKPGQPVNFTMTEIIAFFPQTIRSGDMIRRISWNGGDPAKVASMYLSHRLKEGNTYVSLKNGMLKIFGNSLRVGTKEVKWKGEEYRSGEPPNSHDSESISMNDIRTFGEINPIFGKKDRFPETPVPFASLLKGVKHLPHGPDALDLTRVMEYVAENKEKCKDYFFPDDYFHLLDEVEGPTDPTAENFDRAAFGRWNHMRTDPTWQEECETFLKLTGQESELQNQAQHHVSNPNPNPGVNTPPQQPHIQHQGRTVMTPRTIATPNPGQNTPQFHPSVQRPTTQNQFPNAMTPTHFTTPNPGLNTPQYYASVQRPATQNQTPNAMTPTHFSIPSPGLDATQNNPSDQWSPVHNQSPYSTVAPVSSGLKTGPQALNSAISQAAQHENPQTFADEIDKFLQTNYQQLDQNTYQQNAQSPTSHFGSPYEGYAAATAYTENTRAAAEDIFRQHAQNPTSPFSSPYDGYAAATPYTGDTPAAAGNTNILGLEEAFNSGREMHEGIELPDQNATRVQTGSSNEDANRTFDPIPVYSEEQTVTQDQGDWDDRSEIYR